MMYDEGSPRMFNCRFQDGTLVTNLTYAESLKMFDEAFPTDNPCTIFLQDQPYKAP